MPTIAEATPMFEILQNVIVSICAVTTAIVAIVGLNSWKSQFRSRRNYDLAKRALLNIYKFRDAIESVRSPYISPMPESLSDEEKSFPKKDQDAISLRNGYIKRYQAVDQIRRQIEFDLLEIEILWGMDLKQSIGKIFEFSADVYSKVFTFLDLKAGPPEEQDTELMRDCKSIVYSKSHSDPFTERLNEKVASIETKLKPYVKKL